MTTTVDPAEFASSEPYPGAAEPLNKVQKKSSHLKELEMDRQVWLDECKEITEYILPQKGIYISQGEKPGQKKNRFAKIIDPVASEDNDLLASGIQGGLSSQSRPWFKIEAGNKAVNKLENPQIWMDYVQNMMYSVLANSNFYPKIHNFYNDEGGFGNAVIVCEPDFEKVVNFMLYTAGTYSFSEGKTGAIDTLYLRYPLRAHNIVSLWPDTVSDNTRNLAKTKPFEWIEVCHAIERNEKRDPNRIDYTNMPYSSCWWEYKKPQRFLAEGGYMEKPFAVGRWKTNDTEAYGTGPGHTALGLVKMLQSLQKTDLKARHKEVDPPLFVPAGLKDVLNQLPGGINPTSSNDPRNAIGKLFQMTFDYKATTDKIDRVAAAIHTIFKRDLFLLITDRPEMTATEVVERSQEKLIMIGPVTELQITDVLQPILERVFNIMLRFGMIPPPPPELQGSPLRLVFISLLAQAQKMLGLQGMRSYVEMATAVETLKSSSPDGAAKTNTDYILDEYASNLSLPPQVTRPDDQVGQVRQMYQQMQQMAQEIKMLKEGAQAAQALSNADTTGDNALTAITGKA
jgi:Bacteriophage head to tail connecting protein